MKIVIVFVALCIVFVAARPQEPAQTIRFVDDRKDDGGYAFDFETSDGTHHEEVGTLEDVGAEAPAIKVVGQYDFIAPNGAHYRTTYTSGVKGFAAKTEIIP